MKWSAPHPYPTTRNWTHEQGGRWAGGWEKRIPRIRDSLFQHVNKKKGLSGANMGKSIKSECVIQILFTSAETWAGFEVSHSYPFGPIRPCHRSQMVWRRMRSSGRRGGGGIIFSSLQWNLTCWLSSSILPPGPVEECRAQHAGPWLRESTLFMLCVEGVLSQHSSRCSAPRGCRVLPHPQIWLRRTHKKEWGGKRRQSSPSF